MGKLLDLKYKMLVKSNNFKEKLNKNKVVKGLINSAYPLDITCNNCGKELIKPTRTGLCDKCEEKLRLNDQNICITCGRPFDSETEYCDSCQNNKRYFLFARSSLVYEDLARQLIHEFKFGNKRYLAKYFVNLMVDTYLNNPFNAEVVCAVPLSKKRMVERGYNQSELLAKELSNRLKLTYVDALSKVKDTTDQVGLTRKDRIKNLEGAFKATSEVKGKRVLLVDDVLTTGSTSNECAKTLLKAGAKEVTVLTIASVEEKPYLA